MVFNSTDMYRVVCYIPTSNNKINKFERGILLPEHNTRNETVIIKKTIGGSQELTQIPYYIEIIPNLIRIDRTVMI